jgi:hypothetical protein
VVGLLFWLFIGVPVAVTILGWVVMGIVRLFGGSEK